MSTAPTCACEGCDTPMKAAHGNARYCSDACKSAAWRARHGYRLVGTSNPCQTRKSRRSGRQISYPKAVKAMSAQIHALTTLDAQALANYAARPELCDLLAETCLRDALPDRQRKIA